MVIKTPNQLSLFCLLYLTDISIWFMTTKTFISVFTLQIYRLYGAQTPHHIVAIFAKLRYAMAL